MAPSGFKRQNSTPVAAPADPSKGRWKRTLRRTRSLGSVLSRSSQTSMASSQAPPIPNPSAPHTSEPSLQARALLPPTSRKVNPYQMAIKYPIGLPKVDEAGMEKPASTGEPHGRPKTAAVSSDMQTLQEKTELPAPAPKVVKAALSDQAPAATITRKTALVEHTLPRPSTTSATEERPPQTESKTRKAQAKYTLFPPAK